MADDRDSSRGTALVSGATGFMGRHLTRRLLADGWRVSVLHRTSAQVPEWMRRSCELIDMGSDSAAWTDAVRGTSPQVSFHLAAQSIQVHSPSTVQQLLEANIVVGTHLLEALSARPGTRFVNVGSMWQHFDDLPYAPSSLYAATKQAFVDILTYFVECQNIAATTVEFPDTYGPEDDRGKLLPLLLAAGRTGVPLPMSPGGQVIELLHIHDAVEALVVGCQRASESGEKFQVLGEVLTLREFVALVEFTVGHPIPVDWGGRPYRQRETMHPWRYHPTLPGWQRSRSVFLELSACVGSIGSPLPSGRHAFAGGAWT